MVAQFKLYRNSSSSPRLCVGGSTCTSNPIADRGNSIVEKGLDSFFGRIKRGGGVDTSFVPC